MAACYGIDIAPIETANREFERFAEQLRTLFKVEDPLLIDDDQWRAYANEHRDELAGLMQRYLDAVKCFLDVIHAILNRRLELMESPADSRQYQRQLLELLAIASVRFIRLVATTVASNEAGAELVLTAEASGTLAEMAAYTSNIPTATRPDDAKRHAEAGEEILNSIKTWLIDAVHRLSKKWTLKPIGGAIESVAHMINEIVKLCAGAA